MHIWSDPSKHEQTIGMISLNPHVEIQKWKKVYGKTCYAGFNKTFSNSEFRKKNGQKIEKVS